MHVHDNIAGPCPSPVLDSHANAVGDGQHRRVACLTYASAYRLLHPVEVAESDSLSSSYEATKIPCPVILSYSS